MVRRGYHFTHRGRTPVVPRLSACRAEIESLHDFFVAWYAGERERDAFARVERALRPGFELVTPDGERRDRDAVLEAVRGGYGRDEPGAFDIEVRNVESIHRTGASATVRYEECQEAPAETTGRISTAILAADPSAPCGVAWLDLHETWLEPPVDPDG